MSRTRDVRLSLTQPEAELLESILDFVDVHGIGSPLHDVDVSTRPGSPNARLFVEIADKLSLATSRARFSSSTRRAA